ncbi:unnamed protein product, partial [marine sediment metagenome]
MTNPNNQIERLHTSCQNCIFAKYVAKKQTKCLMDRIEIYFDYNDKKCIKHINNDIEIIEVYNDQQEFFVINNTKCHYKRNESWGKKVKKDNWKKQVKQENRIKYQSIIFATSKLKDVITTIDSLLAQSIPPQYITVVRNVGNTIRPAAITEYLQTVGLPWKLENAVDSELSNLDIIDSVLSKRPYPYYSIFNAGTIIPPDFFQSINTQIYDKQLKFAVLIHDKLPVVVSTSIHYHYE